MAFNIGQKVVCVDPEIKDPVMALRASPLEKGKIYTIETIEYSPSGIPHYTLEEIPVKKINIGWLTHLFFYGHGRFRPLEEDKKDIFTEILNNPHKKIPKDQFDKVKPRKKAKAKV